MRPLIPALLLSAAPACAQLIAHDGMDCGPRSDLAGSACGSGWTTPWIDTGSVILTSMGAPGLVYNNLATLPGAATTPPGSLPDMTDYSRSFPAPTGNAFYASFLIRPDLNFSNWYTFRFGTYPYQVDVGVPIGYYTYGFMLGSGFIVVSNQPVTQDHTELLILEILADAASNRTTYNLFINPTIGAPRPSFPSATYTRPVLLPLSSAVELRGEGGFTFDELRIGTTWDSVLPAAASACYANCDGSTAPPILNVNDFICFQNKYAANDIAANCDGSTIPPVLNVNDFICFQTRYAQGCP